MIDEDSEQVKEILSKTPGWIIRWGSNLTFVIIALLFILSSIIKYPDIVLSNIKIVTKNPPIPIIAKSNGRISQILVSDNEVVAANQILGIIENTAKNEDVLTVKGIVNVIDLDSISTVVFDRRLFLGEVQSSFNYFVKCFNELTLFQKLQSEDVQAKLITKRLFENRILLSKIEKQHKLYSQELTLAEVDYSRYVELLAANSISKKEMETTEREYLLVKRNLEALDIEAIKIKILIIELEQLLQELNMARIERENSLKNAFYDSHKILQLAISEWEEKYLLISPIDGQVSFSTFRSLSQNVRHEEEVFTVLPSNGNDIIGQLLLPIQNSGKVTIGQKVNIKLTNYPYHEFGIVRGEIVHISSISRDDQYAVEIKLLNGLNTTFQKKLMFRQEMSGQAEVVTEDITLLQRIFFQFTKIAKS